MPLPGSIAWPFATLGPIAPAGGILQQDALALAGSPRERWQDPSRRTSADWLHPR
jgi:hypothetical protein